MSEVYRVRDPESSAATTTWQSYTRRCALDDQEVVVSELYWADMSKIGDTSVSRSSAIAQLFLEAPFVLGGAFLKGYDSGIYAWIAWLVRLSNWIMRWPIAGLNIPIFLTAGIAILAGQFVSFAWLPSMLMTNPLSAICGTSESSSSASAFPLSLESTISEGDSLFARARVSVDRFAQQSAL